MDFNHIKASSPPRKNPQFSTNKTFLNYYITWFDVSGWPVGKPQSSWSCSHCRWHIFTTIPSSSQLQACLIAPVLTGPRWGLMSGACLLRRSFKGLICVCSSLQDLLNCDELQNTREIRYATELTYRTTIIHSTFFEWVFKSTVLGWAKLLPRGLSEV